MKKFTHLWLDDKGLKAFNAPSDFGVKQVGKCDCSVCQRTRDLYQQALQQALAEGVYFRNNNDLSPEIITIMQSFNYKMEKLKPYPIPDGYEVKVERVLNQVEMRLEPEEQYAILVPKEKVMFEKDFPTKFNPVVSPKQQSIEEAAEAYAKQEWPYWTGSKAFTDCKYNFIEGAKSQAAKEYWYEQFKREQQ